MSVLRWLFEAQLDIGKFSRGPRDPAPGVAA